VKCDPFQLGTQDDLVRILVGIQGENERRFVRFDQREGFEVAHGEEELVNIACYNRSGEIRVRDVPRNPEPLAP